MLVLMMSAEQGKQYRVVKWADPEWEPTTYYGVMVKMMRKKAEEMQTSGWKN
jgi:hypothetical protein